MGFELEDKSWKGICFSILNVLHLFLFTLKEKYIFSITVISIIAHLCYHLQPSLQSQPQWSLLPQGYMLFFFTEEQSQNKEINRLANMHLF